MRATDDAEALIASEADCVLFAPLVTDVDAICRLLAAGKNVVSPAGPFCPTERFRKVFDRIDAACKSGGTSYHGCGIHPGFSGDLLPLTAARLMNRIDRIEVTEFIDKLKDPMVYTEMMGFGRDPDELLANPSRSPEAPYHFEGSMQMVAAGLGTRIEKITTRLEVARATRDIPYSLGIGLPNTGIIRRGTVGGQHFEWTGWAEGKPLIVYNFYWSMGPDNEPRWDLDSRYEVTIHGDPGLELRLTGLPWTGLVGATVVPQVCDAPPGIVTHIDLGVVNPRGLVR